MENTEQYLVDPADCLIVLAVQGAGSLREAARHLGCDPGGLLRKVQRISEDHGLLQKVNGRWTATERGLAAVAWARESIQQQKRHLLSERSIRIASTTWFAEGVLIPQSTQLSKFLGPVRAQFTVPDANFEKSLISGDCDFVVVCHPPENPVIAHKQLGREPWSVVAAPSFLAKHGLKTSKVEALLSLPFVRHADLNPESLLPRGASLMYAPILVDNLIGVRSAVLSSIGWSIVPTALVTDDLKWDRLQGIDHEIEMNRKICVWWLRNSMVKKKTAADFCDWVEAASAKIG